MRMWIGIIDFRIELGQNPAKTYNQSTSLITGGEPPD
jgi:hypothetical protein